MSWTFRTFAHKNINDVLLNLRGQINALTAAQAATAKIATSNQESGDARGVVFWYTGTIPGSRKIGGGWAGKRQTTGHDYDALYQFVVELLDQIPIERAIISHVAMANHHDGDALISVWAPAETQDAVAGSSGS